MFNNGITFKSGAAVSKALTIKYLSTITFFRLCNIELFNNTSPTLFCCIHLFWWSLFFSFVLFCFGVSFPQRLILLNNKCSKIIFNKRKQYNSDFRAFEYVCETRTIANETASRPRLQFYLYAMSELSNRRSYCNSICHNEVALMLQRRPLISYLLFKLNLTTVTCFRWTATLSLRMNETNAKLQVRIYK